MGVESRRFARCAVCSIVFFVKTTRMGEEAMRSRILLAALPLVLVSEGHASAQDRTTVTACDTLIATRRIDAATGPDRAVPEAGCRQIPKADIGTVEQRALIGGAPYECLNVAGAGHCLWVVP